MWECEHCGTTNIAGSLEQCPHCQEPRTLEPVGTAAPTEGEGEETAVPSAASDPAPPPPASNDKEGSW